MALIDTEATGRADSVARLLVRPGQGGKIEGQKEGGREKERATVILLSMAGLHIYIDPITRTNLL